MYALTERQRQALEILIHHSRAWHESPTLRQLAAALGISVNAANELVKRLEAKGYVRRMAFLTRGLRVVQRPLELRMDNVAADGASRQAGEVSQ